MLMRTHKDAYFGYWNSFNDLVDDKPSKWDREPPEEYRMVRGINDRVHRVYSRRFSNREEWGVSKSAEQHIVVVTPFYNARDYIAKCVESVAAQDYDNWSMILIDDSSTDDGFDVASRYVDNLPQKIREKIETFGK